MQKEGSFCQTGASLARPATQIPTMKPLDFSSFKACKPVGARRTAASIENLRSRIVDAVNYRHDQRQRAARPNLEELCSSHATFYRRNRLAYRTPRQAALSVKRLL